jgi:tetratricopeptide (TPR) repeat protein
MASTPTPTSTTAPNQLYPRALNNKGVILLEAGRYAEAAAYFKKASKMMMSVITHQHQARKAKISRGSSPASSSTQPLALHQVPPEVPKPTTTGTPVNELSPTKGVPQSSRTSEPFDQPPRKRRRRSSMATSFVLPSHSLGRPLWVQARGQRKKPLDSVLLSATLLYNLGLCFNMIASRKPKEEAKPVYRKALELYKMSSELILRGPANNSIESPVFVVSLHNMVQVYNLLEETELATKHRGQLAHVLRLMGSSAPGNCDIRYEEFYIKLLSLPKANSMAAAA